MPGGHHGAFGRTFVGFWTLRVGLAVLELGEVGDDLGAGPVLGAYELAAENALAVDDIGFRDLDGAVQGVDLGVGVADSGEVDGVFEQEGAIDFVVLIHADSDNLYVRELLLHG